MTFAGMYRFKFGKFPIIYKALIIPQSKLIEVDNRRFVMKVPIMIELLPLSIAFKTVFMLALAFLLLDN